MKKRQQQGFNLVEVLVAMVILSIGLLGIAGLQLMGVRANQGSYFRSQATAIMTDASERMHNNQPGIRAGAYATFDSQGFGCGAPAAICAQENGGPVPARCTTAQMATYDLFVLACGMRAGGARVDRISDLLPGGRIVINCVNNATPPAPVAGAACLGGFRHQVTVTWAERSGSSAGSEQEQAIETQTVTMVVQP